MFYKSDWAMWQLLLSIKKGLDDDFDYLLVVVGDTGVGKSNFGLHLVETWQKVIGKEVNGNLIEQVNVDKLKWLKKFKDLDALDINLFDEGAAGLGSKQYMERFSRTLEMLFQVVRYKRFFTVIIVPNFFRLNKFFREDRLRGLVHVNKRGEYKFYTRERILKLCQINERKVIKNMKCVHPAFKGRFPKYEGNLLNAYDTMKDEGVERILNDVIKINEEDSGVKQKKIREKEEVIEWWIRKMYATGKIRGHNKLFSEIPKIFKYPYPNNKISKILKITTPEEFEKAKTMVFKEDME